MKQAIYHQEEDYNSVMKLANRLKLDREEIRRILGISESTQFRYEKSNPTLRPNLLDRWSRLTRIVEIAKDLFEEDSEIKNWLSTRKQSLENCTPLELLSTNAGSRQVEQILLQSIYGVFA